MCRLAVLIFASGQGAVGFADEKAHCAVERAVVAVGGGTGDAEADV